MQVGALNALANGIGSGLNSFATHTAKAASRANGVSAAAQTAAANFNAGQAATANNINTSTLNNQYGFNSGQASIANQFTEHMWDRAAAWNEDMFNRQLEFNAEQAQINREWQERMRATAYQTAVKDMHAAGLNPILAATNGISAGTLTGSPASVSAPSMSSASGAMASGGLLGADSASISGYTGQMESVSGMLGLLSAAIGGISSAMSAMGGMGKFGESLADGIGAIFKDVFKDKDEPTTHKDSSGNQMTYQKGLYKFFNDNFETRKGSLADKYMNYLNHNYNHNSSSGKW